MSKSLLLFCTAALLALAPAASLCATPQQTAPAASAGGTRGPAKPTAEGLAKAKTLYQIDCAMCHGDNGNGKTDLATSMSLTLDDWTSPDALAGKDDQALFTIIRNGKDKMPPEEATRANDPALSTLIVYIRGFSKGGSAAK